MTVEAEHVYVDAINFQIKESFDLKTFQAKLQSTQFVSKKKTRCSISFYSKRILTRIHVHLEEVLRGV